MGWLTTANDTNKIVDSEEPIDETLDILVLGQAHLERHSLLKHHRYVGMTYEAASTVRLAKHDPSNGVTASLQRENEAGAYQVVVVEWDQGEWEEP